jgi:hypothetical protein
VARRKLIGLYITMDTIAKRVKESAFSLVKDYRHKNVIKEYEVNQQRFNRVTQTFRKYFMPLHFSVQVAESHNPELQTIKILSLERLMNKKAKVIMKGSFEFVKLFIMNLSLEEIRVQISEVERAQNKKNQRAELVEMNKKDTDLRFVLILVDNFVHRNNLKHLLEAFNDIECSGFQKKLKAFATKNVVSLLSRRIGKEFQSLRMKALSEPEEMLFDHCILTKGLLSLELLVKKVTYASFKHFFKKLSLESRFHNRMSIQFMSKNSIRPDQKCTLLLRSQQGD